MQIFALLAAALVLACQPLQAAPADWLWAWDRTEDLRWLESDVGVAYFAAQLEVRGDAIRAQMRRPPLRVRPDTPLRPVIHIEAFYRNQPVTMDETAVEHWVQSLAAIASKLPARDVQIDFEARLSQRAFYLAVLQALRQRLGQDWRISITALASWCGDAEWLNRLPVDEIVPMYFRMGPVERALWRGRVLRQENLPPRCKAVAGFATDEWSRWQEFGNTEALAPLTRYWFAPKPWLEADWQALKRRSSSTAK